MNWLLSLLLMTYISMVIATSEPNHVMIAKHLTTMAHSFQTLQSSGPTSSVFGPVAGVSDACKATSASLENNSTIITAKNAVITSGCTKPSTQQTCSSSTRTCTCITNFANDANLRSLVTSSGGQVCSMNMQFTAASSDGVNVDFNYQGIGGLAVAGSACTTNDIQTMLSYGMDAVADSIRESSSSSSGTKVLSISGTISFCGTSYTGKRSTNGAYQNQPMAIAMVILMGIISTIINVTL